MKLQKFTSASTGLSAPRTGLIRIRTLLCALLFVASPTLAMELNGIAVHSELRRDFYVGALYATVPGKNSDELLSSEQHKRMVLRVLAPRWSARSFEQHWTQSILINNEQQALSTHSDEILNFTAAVQEKLVAGDELLFEHEPGKPMRFSLNGTDLYTAPEKGAGFFDLLLNAWIGARPPSSSFKRDILQAPDDSDKLLTIFNSLVPTEDRIAEVQKWVESTRNTAAKLAESTSSKKQKADKKNTNTQQVVENQSAVAQAAAVSKTAVAKASKPASQSVASGPSTETADLASATVAATSAATKASAKAVARATELAREQELEAEEQARRAKEYERQLSGLRLLYRSNIMKIIYSKVVYPGRAIDRNQEGDVNMRVILDPNGKLVDASVTTESDYSLLNKAAMKALQEAAPFPPAPKKLTDKEIELDIPIRFQIPR